MVTSARTPQCTGRTGCPSTFTCAAPLFTRLLTFPHWYFSHLSLLFPLLVYSFFSNYMIIVQYARALLMYYYENAIIMQRSKRTYVQYAARLNNEYTGDEKLRAYRCVRVIDLPAIQLAWRRWHVFVDMASGAHTSNYVSALVIFVVLGTVYLAAHLC